MSLGYFFHSWSPVASTVYPSCLSCDFLNANNAVPAKPMRHTRNKAIIREGREPIKGWELQLTEARRKRIVHTAIVWKLYISSVPIMLKKNLVHNTQFPLQISQSTTISKPIERYHITWHLKTKFLKEESKP